MSPFAFASRVRNLIAMIMSAFTVLALIAYITAPVSALPLVASSYRAARHPVVAGLVESSSKSELRNAHVTLIFRNAAGEVIATRHPRISNSGRWHTTIPEDATKVTISVRVGGRLMKLTKPILAGRSLQLTEVLPGRPAGLLPGLFPY